MQQMDDLFRGLMEYLKENWIPEEEYCPDGSRSETIREGTKWADYTPDDAKNLEVLIREIGESFQEMLFRKIDERHMTDAEVYKKAGLDRKLFSKIRSNPAYHPRKRTVLALAIALSLNLDETAELLKKAGYALSPGEKQDVIVKYFIEKEVYDINVINIALQSYDQPLLAE